MILKNTTGQGIHLYAYNKTTGEPIAGDQANITGFISKDGPTESAFATANPSNVGGGLYWQPLSQSESNCNAFGMRWDSSTADILIDPIIGFTDQGRLNDTITSRAPAATALTNATWTDARAARIDFLDVSVASRLATSGYTAPTTPPTVTQIRQEMDTNSTKLDVSVGSRLASASYVAPTAPPTAVAIRQEMDSNSTKLANLDTNVGSRMATFVYTVPPAAVDIANQVDTAMAPRFDGLSTYDGGPVEVADKTGFSLASTGLDAIPATLTGVPTTFVQKLMWVFHEKWRATRSKSTGVKSVYGSNGSVITNQATTDTDTQQTIGAGTAP